MSLIKAQIRNKLRLVLRPLMETDEAMEFVIDDVLSPLGGLGECVAEGKVSRAWSDKPLRFSGRGLMGEYVGWLPNILNAVLEPGDRIAIYKIKAKINWPNKEQFDRELANYPSMKEE